MPRRNGLPDDVCSVARLPAAVISLTPRRGGGLVAGLNDGSVWRVAGDGATAALLPPSGAPVLALVDGDAGLVAVDEARLVRVVRSAHTDVIEIPATAGRTGYTFGREGPPRPVATCAALDPSGACAVVAVDDRIHPRADRLFIFDMDRCAIVAELDVGGRPGDDCFNIEHVATDARGERLAVSALGIRYMSDLDWAWGQDERVAVFTLPSGARRLVCDVGQSSRPSQHVPKPLAFAGDLLVAGPYAIDWLASTSLSTKRQLHLPIRAVVVRADRG